jgi:hypothetical protein
MVVCRSAVEAIIEQLGTDQLDTLFLALPLEAVPLIGQYYSIYLIDVHLLCQSTVSNAPIFLIIQYTV